MNAPVAGLQVLELGGIDPVPHAATVLGDLGADVPRVQRPGDFTRAALERDHLLQSYQVHVVDVKSADGLEQLRGLVAVAEVLLGGFRPGVAERLGLEPDELTERNPRLVCARMTGWGQYGPLAASARARHQLHLAPRPPARDGTDRRSPCGHAQRRWRHRRRFDAWSPAYLAAMWALERSGAGQVVDAAMIDGSALLVRSIWPGAGSARRTPGATTCSVDCRRWVPTS
ncbi:CoA transferase [Nocardia gamkensis]|uniref:CoA transferase n=1 Tax=Nocardia gamkensis TaxID=352869 RepID=UPI0037C6E564